jgi:hypothetical protein
VGAGRGCTMAGAFAYSAPLGQSADVLASETTAHITSVAMRLLVACWCARIGPAGSRVWAPRLLSHAACELGMGRSGSWEARASTGEAAGLLPRASSRSAVRSYGMQHPHTILAAAARHDPLCRSR